VVAFKQVKDPMLLAIEAALEGIRKGHGGPFGACIVKDREIIAVAYNTVLRDNDPTAHAEINAIREACRKLGTWNLEGCEIYSTTEPCPMCFAAIHWARISRVYYGTTIDDVAELGFNELPLKAEEIKKLTGTPVEIVPGYKVNECRRLLEEWKKLRLPTY